ncbi:hypothetical protein [Micromonospora chalcea]|uniref:hypothetical protein n=1 Tax=Micromonospora chalcea TaxID=1874 RepID=UPI003790A639
MYELSRVRLYSVGPEPARYQDVTLDFSDIGRPVRFQADTLLEPHQPHRRPSPASVLFLENGGGKSVLLKLIFSVMLPKRRQIVGTTSTRVLENFVLAGDVAHVVLEWMHAETGRLLLTGKVSEWRNNTVSGDPENLATFWYCLRPTEAVRLDTLPFAADRRLVSRVAFRQRLAEKFASDPRLEFFASRQPGEWTRQLDQLGLDPELFRYQREMNADEGEAAGTFTFATDEAFVEFLLRAVVAEEDPGEIADLVAQHSRDLAQRDGLLLECEFVAGALDRLVPLADAHKAARATEVTAVGAQAAIDRFAQSVAARSRAEQELLAVREQYARETAEALAAARTDAEHRQAAVKELKRLALVLQLSTARATEAVAKQDHEDADALAESWRETEKAAELRAADAAAAETAALVEDAEESARPILDAKKAAAAQLARGLLQVANKAADAAKEAGRLATDCTAGAAAAEDALVRETQEAARLDAGAAVAAKRIGEIDMMLSDAAASGLLPAGPSAAAAALATEAATEVGRRLTAAEEKAAEFDEERVAAVRVENDAATAVVQANEARLRAMEAYEAAAARAAELAGRPRLAELIDSEEVRLATDAEPLAERLAAAVAQAESARARLQAEATADERIRTALEADGLLPPPAEVTAACEALNDAGIVAWSGWDHLTQIDNLERRRELLRGAPQLVSGVVLNDPAQLADAGAVLASREIYPVFFVGIGTTEALHQAEPAGAEAFVPLNPALYDQEAAEAARAAVERRDEERREQLATIARSLVVDQELIRDLRDWRRDFPPGRLTEMEEHCADLTAGLEQAESAHILAAEATRDVTDRRTAVRDSLPGLRAELLAAEQRDRDLQALARHEAERRTLDESRRQALADAATHARLATAARELAQTRREEATGHQRHADGQSDVAVRARRELAQVPGGGDVSPDAPVPAEPVEVLRARFIAASDAYTRGEVGAELRVRLDQAEREQARARSRFEELTPAVRQRALELLDTPEGADFGSRSAARRRSTDRVVRASENLRTAVAATAAINARLSELTEQRALPADFIAPADEDNAAALLNAAERAAARADRRHAELGEVAEKAGAELEAARGIARGFADLAEDLDVSAGESASAFSDDLDTARARKRSLRTALNAANDSAATERARLTRTTEALRRHAVDSRFRLLQSTIRQQMSALDSASLAGHADEWITALRPRLRSLTDELTSIDRHRDMINVRLHGMVGAAFRTLRNAQRLSRLPEGLDGWSGQEFLRVAYQPLEEAALLEAIGEVVDEVVDGGGVDGMTLLLRCVRRAVPRGFRVDVLKPDSALRPERQRVSEIKDVFSGGQQLTAAIILYCTMAALRANNRGRIGNRHSGVLFLDNPIGRASAGYLLELQRSVAATLGVQLIYTTGLFDANALSAFPLIIRLRNDSDLRAGRKYLAVDHVFRKRLDELGPEDAGGELTAIRTFVRAEH